MQLSVIGAAALQEALDSLDITVGKVDLSGCRLQQDCLPYMVDWMEWKGDRVSVHVGGSGISMLELCRALVTKMGHVEWIITGRVSVRDSEQGRELDKVHAEGFMQGRVVSMEEALGRVGKHLEEAARINEETARRHEESAKRHEESEKEHKTLRQEIKQLHDSAKKFEKETKSVRSWFKSHTDSYEVLVTQLTRMYVSRAYSMGHASDVFELERSRHIIPEMLPVYERGVEWDGVLYAPEARHLFLVEAKSALETQHVNNMQSRMKRTVEFIKLCRNGELPLQTSCPKFETIELCSSWARFASARKVFGVIGGIGFTQYMLDAADEQGLLRVVPKEGIYDILMPSSQRLISAVPPTQEPEESLSESTEFVSKTFTAQEVDDDAEEMLDKLWADCT